MQINTRFLPLFNISIKGLTLLGKFGLVFYIARYLEPEEIGIYGLIVALISYSLYAVGLDFYTYSTRELVKIESIKWWKYLKSQLFLICTTYIFIVPILLYIVYQIIGGKWIIFFLILLLLEHLNQEIMRLLIVAKHNVWANNLNFIRQGLWCFFVVFVMILSLMSNSLETVLILWIVFSFIALIIGIIIIKCNITLQKETIDIQWIKKGIKVSSIFLIATLCTRSVTTLDRIFLEYFSGLAIVGAYSLYFSLTNALIAFLDTGVFSFIYPKMIENIEDKGIFISYTKKLTIQTFIATILISLSLIILTPFLLKWIEKEVYLDNIELFYIVLSANAFYCVSMIFHYVLYAYKEDKKILASQIISLLFFLVSILVFNLFNIEYSVAWSVLLSFVGLLLLKYSYARQFIN